MEQLIRPVDLFYEQDQVRPNVSRIPADRYRADSDRINFLRVRSVAVEKALLRKNRVLTDHEPAAVRECYQLLRTQVLQRFRQEHWQTLAITSPGVGAGKTLTAINLAVSMAKELAYTVVLVDANLRRPALQQQLGLGALPGLSEYLTDLIPIEELLVRPYFLEDLIVLPGGQAVENSAEMLNSPKMERLVADLKASTDKCIIVFDMPPALTTAETLSFSPQVDAALLVIEDGVTDKADIVRTVDLLGTTNIVGTVLNKAGADFWK